MSNRIDRVNSLLEHEISSIIAKDFTFSDAMVTLTRIKTTANLIEARAYVSVMFTQSSKRDGWEEETEKIIQTLNSNIHDIQQKINKKLNMRPIPKIRFVKDNSVADAAHIENILDALKKEKH